MPAPVMTQNASGNLVTAGTSIAASATTSTLVVDATTKLEIQLQFDVLTGGTAQAGVAATVKIYGEFGGTPTADNVPVTQFQILMGTAATHYIQSVRLSTGKYGVTVTNGDTANAITYALTSSTIDG
jgi:hypothetical protein